MQRSRSGGVMFMGGNYTLAAMMPMALQSLVMIATAKACVAFQGMSVTVLPYNFGISAYFGVIQ